MESFSWSGARQQMTAGSDYSQNSAPQPKGHGWAILVVLILMVALGGLFALGFLPRITAQKELKEAHAETVDAVPVVRVITAAPAANIESVVLPGNIGAIQYTTIYARIDGYLKSRMVDIGDHVKKGQLIAEIDTPTTDQKVNQARADVLEAKAKVAESEANLKEAIAKQDQAAAQLERSKANNNFADVTANRWKNMAVRGAVSLQSRDEKVRSFESTSADVIAAQADFQAAQSQVQVVRAQIKAAEANLVAKDANLSRVSAEQAFKRVLAPFDGIITLRKVDPGALITEGSQSSNLELYQMAKIDRLRVYVNVPQRVARYLKPGMQADVMVQEFPERKFVGKVTNVSGALDPNTRTRQTEIQIDNPEHFLLPGMYAEIRLSDLRDKPWIRVPGTTIVTKADGLFVVVVKDGKAHYQQIQLGRDFGNEVEVRSGLNGSEQVIVSPSDDLQDGDRVKIAEEPPAAEKNKKS
jgi:RND family efflux transporter MFP subunit